MRPAAARLAIAPERPYPHAAVAPNRLPVTPLNATQVMLLTQVVLVIIVAAGVAMLRAGERRSSRIFGGDRVTDGIPSAMVLFALVSVGLLLLTLGSPLLSAAVLRHSSVFTVNRPLAFFLVSVLNLLLATWLIVRTGGYGESPFGIMLFALPAFAMFLPLPAAGFIVYACVAGLLLILLVRVDPGTIARNPHHKGAFAVVNTGCLGLLAVIGYVTHL